MKWNQSKFAMTLSLCATFTIPNIALAVAISGQGSWESTLQGRDLDGNLATFEAYYDTILNITWLADANHAGTNMDWATALTWAASLNPYGSGITGWRLPTTNPIDGTTVDDAILAFNGSEDRGANVSAPGTVYAGSITSEMAHLFYNTLGNKSNCDPILSTVSTCSPQAVWGLTNAGPFSNTQPVNYWSVTGYAPGTSNDKWRFNFYSGFQDYSSKIQGGMYAWAVHAGDVGTSVVPVPAAAWLFGSGLLGLVGMGRKRRRMRLR